MHRHILSNLACTVYLSLTMLNKYISKTLWAHTVMVAIVSIMVTFVREGHAPNIHHRPNKLKET